MQYRKLGHTGLDVSAVACGSWQLGGKRWKSGSEEETIALLRYCREKGINLFDVSTAYGQYQDDIGCYHSLSQELIGKAFKGCRDEVIINLKLGHLDEYTHRRDFSPKFLINSFQQSLKRLQTDYVDICLVHAPSIVDIEAGKAISVLQTLREQGLVGAVGYSLENEPEHLLKAIKQDIDVIELQYNLISRECEDAIKEAQRFGVGIMASGIYKRGILTGKYRSVDALPAEDEYWEYNKRLCKGRLESWIDCVDRLFEEYRDAASLRRAALEFALLHPGISTLVLGHRTIEEVDDNIKLCNDILSELKPFNIEELKQFNGVTEPLEHEPA